MNRIFVTGIGTGIGKTIVSAILTEVLQADYWKPIQSGLEEMTDTEKVKSLVSNKKSVFYPEAYRLKLPASPHAAAAAEGIKISIRDIKAPNTSNHLLIEGAGGVMVPLNEKELMVDLIRTLNTSVVVVIKHYLGSINHSLLTLEALKQRNIQVAGIVFNGEQNIESEKVIMSFYNYPIIGMVKEEKVFTPETISLYANEFRTSEVMKGFVTKK